MRLPQGRFFGEASRVIHGRCGVMSARTYAPLQQQPWHVHERPTLFFQVSGQHMDESPSSEWRMSELSLIYHPTDWRHRSRLGPHGARGINIELEDEWLNRNHLCSKDLGAARALPSDQVGAVALRSLVVYSESAFTECELESLLFDLVETLIAPSSNPPGSPPWLKGLEEGIAHRFREPLTVAALAREVGVHPVHAARAFKAKHGQTINNRIQRLRVIAAVRQVLHGDSLGSAALDAGFADQSHFARTLKAHFGYCPKLVKRLKCCNRS